jgi:hypothetical protein
MTTPASLAHAARVQRYAYAALAIATILAAYVAIASRALVLGVKVPLVVTLALVAAGAIAGVVAVVRRHTPLAFAGAGLLVLGVTPGGALDPGLAGYAAGFAFGALLLAYTELVHQTSRYDRAHRIIEEEGVSEDSLDRVTDEALRTLLTRAGLAVGLAAAGALLVLLLRAVGPQPFREGIETSAPLGVAVASLFLFAILTVIVLLRGASFRFRREKENKEVVDLVVE